MKIRSALFITALMGFAGQAMANDCEFTVESNDAMQFVQKEITVSKSCETFKVTLKHIGTLPKNVMGHNWVLSKAADVSAIASEGMSSTVEKSYLKDGEDRVIAHTSLIGGGESTSVSFNVKDLKEGEEYAYFCSFPGHFAVMRGTLLLK